MSGTLLALAVLGPPALFGTLIALEQWRDDRRARRRGGPA
jgi:hypothetical protein